MMPSSAFRPGTKRYSPPFDRDERRKLEQERAFGPRHQHLRTLAAGAVDRVLLLRIESDELTAYWDAPGEESRVTWTPPERATPASGR
jgi:hypothetical protein